MKKTLAVVALFAFTVLPLFAGGDIDVAKTDTIESAYYQTAVPTVSAYPVDFNGTTPVSSFTFSGALAATAQAMTIPTGTKRMAVSYNGDAACQAFWGPSTVSTANGIPLATASNTWVFFAGSATDLAAVYFVRSAVTATPSIKFMFFDK